MQFYALRKDETEDIHYFNKDHIIMIERFPDTSSAELTLTNGRYFMVNLKDVERELKRISK